MEDGDKATQASTQDTGAIARLMFLSCSLQNDLADGPTNTAIGSPSFGKSLWGIQSSAIPWEHRLPGVGGQGRYLPAGMELWALPPVSLRPGAQHQPLRVSICEQGQWTPARMPTPCPGPKAWVPSVTQAKARLEGGLAGGRGGRAVFPSGFIHAWGIHLFHG